MKVIYEVGRLKKILGKRVWMFISIIGILIIAENTIKFKDSFIFTHNGFMINKNNTIVQMKELDGSLISLNFETSPIEELINKDTKYFYKLYDNIISKNKNLLKQEVLGMDQSNNYEIKQITYTPINGYNKTIFITAGIHGNEKVYPYIIYEFLKLLASEEVYVNEFSKFKEETRVIIIPIVNPYGVDNNKRQNINNVDINRNFNHKWDNQHIEAHDPNGIRYKGISPFSENESKYVRLVMESNDINSYIDCHNFGENSERDYVMYCSKETEQISRDIISKLANKDDITEFYQQGSDSCAANYAESIMNIPSMTLEAIRNDGEIDDVENMNKAFTLFINHIIQYAKLL